MCFILLDQEKSVPEKGTDLQIPGGLPKINMKDNLLKHNTSLVNTETSDSDSQSFSLDRIKSPALLIDSAGLILKSNKEAHNWIGKSTKETKGQLIFDLIPELSQNLVSEIHSLHPGKSLTKEIIEAKLSFFPTHHQNAFAVLVLVSVKNPFLLGKMTENLNAEKRKENLKNSPKSQIKSLSQDWKMSRAEVNVQLLLGELAQLAIQESNASDFLNQSTDLISKRLDLDIVYFEQIGQSFGEINHMTNTVWSGAKNQIEKYNSIPDWVNPIVLEKNTHFVFSENELENLFNEDFRLQNQKKPTYILGLPVIYQNDCIGILGLISFSEKNKEVEFEYYGILVADLLSSILGKFNFQNTVQAQANRYQKIADQHGDVFWSVLPDGTVSYFNPAFIDAVVKKGANFGTKISHQKTKDSKIKIGFSNWEQEYNKAFEGEKVEIEYQSIDIQGKVVWWEIKFIPGSGTGLGNEEVLGIARDVSQNRIQQGEINQKQSQYLELIDAFDDVYFQADKAGVILSISSAIEKIAGLKPEEVVGMNIRDFLISSDEMQKKLVALRDGQLVSGLELSIKTLDSKTIFMVANLKPMYSSWNDWVGFEGIARDFSQMEEARKNESKSKIEASDALKIKERFLANISHEIRTPLNGIMGMAQILKDSQLKETQKEYVDIILRSGDSLVHVLNHLIDLSESENSKIILKTSEVNVVDLVKGISRLYFDQARLKNIEFSSEIEPGLSNILADESRMYQLLNNLVSNAFKFTIQGNIKIKLTREEGINGNELVLEVSDTGCGLSAAEQLSIRQLNDSSNPEYAILASQGGLGLLTSKLITDAMNGQFGFVSSPGLGSTFWIKVPLIQLEETKTLTFNSSEKLSFFEGYVPEVLLVDDNAINLKVAYEILVKSGCHVDVATNGEEAVDKVKSGFYHVILMDIQMPVMDGITATHIIKGMDLKWNPAIVAMTAYCLKEDKIRFIEAGMDDFIAKPISADKILSKVKYWTEKGFGNKNPDLEKENDFVPEIKYITIRGELSSVFDFDALKSLHKHLGEDILLDSIHEFALETAKMMTEMDAALLMGDHSILRSHAHTLKGNAGTFGVNHLSAIAKEIEFDLKNNKIAALSDQLEKLREAANQFLKSYNLLNKSHEWKN